MIGILPVVLFTPDDLSLIKAGASERRRLLDLPLCQIRPFYYETLSRYNRTLRMKRALLKEEYNEDTISFVFGERVMTIREAIFAKQEVVSVTDAVGRICGSPAVSCPPAIPIVVSGELIDETAVQLFQYYGIETVEVVKE